MGTPTAYQGLPRAGDLTEGPDASRGSSEALLGVDVGGTFTDAVLIAGGSVFTAKRLSTDPQHDGVMAAIRDVLREAKVRPEAVARFVHGMTVATNALLERRGARVVFVGTEGFADLLAIGRQDREALYTLFPSRLPPLVPRDRCLGVRERVTDGAVALALSEAEVERVSREVARLEPEAVAVCLLWSFRHPDHERLLARGLELVLPGVPVTISSEISPLFREYERASTVAVDAYLTPCTRGYLENLAHGCRVLGLREPEIMQSSGGTIDLAGASRHAARLLLSGPAGGVVAALANAHGLALEGVVTFDMGGTSTDCAAFPRVPGDGSEPLPTSSERAVAGVPVRLPMLDIHTVSAGGGSIAWFDEAGALKVGPRSAGAHPGPASYGKGGSEPTVTDAHVVLGRIAFSDMSDQGLRLDARLARESLERLGRAAGLDPLAAALGVARVATFNMATALRAVTLSRGLDPRGWALMAFGGAGGLHACALADEVGIETVVLPSHAGVLSALGLAVSGRRADSSSTVLWRAGRVDRAAWAAEWSRLEKEAAARVEGGVALHREVEARYRGQSHELTVALAPGDGSSEVAAEFHAVHERRHGYRDAEEEVEIVTLRVVATCRAPSVPLEPPGMLVNTGNADVFVEGDWERCPIVGIELEDCPGRGVSAVEGPAIVAAPGASAYVAPGWRLVAAAGACVMRR